VRPLAVILLCTATLERCQPAVGWTNQLLQVGNEEQMGETVVCVEEKKVAYWILVGKPKPNRLEAVRIILKWILNK